MAQHALAVVEPTPVARAAWEEEIETIKATVAVGVTDSELRLFLYQARRTGLDPLLRQIHCVKRQGKAVIQVGIDGLRLIADRTERYAGSDPPQWESSGDKIGSMPCPDTASITVWKIVGGQRQPFTATVRWAEFCPPSGQDFQWKKMPYHMLAKVAESHALRKAFPAETSGLYIREEMDQAGLPDGDVIDAEATIQTIPATRHVAAGREPVRRERYPDAKTDERPQGDGHARQSDAPGESLPVQTMPITETRMRELHAIGREKGLTHDELHALAVSKGVPSIPMMTEQQGVATATWLRTATPDRLRTALAKAGVPVETEPPTEEPAQGRLSDEEIAAMAATDSGNAGQDKYTR